jgi:hypothetical protein
MCNSPLCKSRNPAPAFGEGANPIPLGSADRPLLGLGRRVRASLLWALALGLLFTVHIEPRFLLRATLTGDDASYFAHAATLGLDLDLDYSNEHVEVWNARRTIASHPIGAGFMAAPMVAAFGLVDRASGHPVIRDRRQVLHSWSLFGFLLAANAWFLLGVVLFWRGARIVHPSLDLRWSLWLAAATGVTYYVLRRFTMAHAFEFGALGLQFWAVARLHVAWRSGDRTWGWVGAGAAATVLAIAVRPVNLNVLLYPYILLLALRLVDPAATGPPWRLAGRLTAALAVAAVPLAAFNLRFFGSVHPSSAAVYGSDVRGLDSSTFPELVAGVLALTPNLVPLLLSSEFGLLYSNPVVVVGCAALLVLLTWQSRGTWVAGWGATGLSVAAVGFSFALVLWWQTTASGYGFRYILVLYPLALLGLALLFRAVEGRTRARRILVTGLVALGAVSFTSQLFFQASPRLSTRPAVNVFGVHHEYSAKGYMLELAAAAPRPSTWAELAARRYPGLVAADLAARGVPLPGVDTVARERLSERFAIIPAVHVQLLILMAVWVGFGWWVGVTSERRQ